MRFHKSDDRTNLRWSAAVKLVQRTTTMAAIKVAKIYGLRNSVAIKVKAESTAKQVVPVAVNPVRVVSLIQPADRPWRNAKVLKVNPQLAVKPHRSG